MYYSYIVVLQYHYNIVLTSILKSLVTVTVCVGSGTGCCCSVWLFHTDLLNAERPRISVAPAVNSTLFIQWEAAKEITHTVTFIQGCALTCTRSYTHLCVHPSTISKAVCMHTGAQHHKRRHTAFVVPVSHSATCTLACNAKAGTRLLSQECWLINTFLWKRA